MAIKVGMVSLGCAKNQVDGEMLMASLKNAGFELCDDAALADVAIVNTCGFIESAKQESIDEILELATLKKEGRIKKLVVTGCLAERYREEIHKELPEVDGVFGIGANGDIAACIESAMAALPGEGKDAAVRRPRAFDAELLRVPQDRRGLRQPLHLLRDPADPRRLPQPHDGERRGGGARAR